MLERLIEVENLKINYYKKWQDVIYFKQRCKIRNLINLINNNH